MLFFIVHHSLMIVSPVDRPNHGLPTTKESFFSRYAKRREGMKTKSKIMLLIGITPPDSTNASMQNDKY